MPRRANDICQSFERDARRWKRLQDSRAGELGSALDRNCHEASRRKSEGNKHRYGWIRWLAAFSIGSIREPTCSSQQFVLDFHSFHRLSSVFRFSSLRRHGSFFLTFLILPVSMFSGWILYFSSFYSFYSVTERKERTLDEIRTTTAAVWRRTISSSCLYGFSCLLPLPIFSLVLKFSLRLDFAPSSRSLSFSLSLLGSLSEPVT